MTSIDRRKFISGAATAAAGGAALAVPGVASAQSAKVTMKMTNAYPPGSPFYVAGPLAAPPTFARKWKPCRVVD
jgi:TRAP-type mannitol/chloroaromatic compound transport system substrate-binding protein